MDTLLTGLMLAIDHAPTVIVFAAIIRFGRCLDLSVDAIIAIAAVIYCESLRDTGSFMIAAGSGVAGALLLTILRFALSEWGNIPIEVCSLLLAFIVFRSLAVWVGDISSIPMGTPRVYSIMYSYAPWVPTAFSICVLIGYMCVLEWVRHTHVGLMFRALGDNPLLPVRWPHWQVLGVVMLGAAALTGFAGVIQADRVAQASTAFRLDRLVDAFIIAEVTSSIERRLRLYASGSSARWHRLFITVARIPPTLQICVAWLLLGSVSYVLLCRLEQNLPSIVYAAIVLLMLLRGPSIRWRRQATHSNASPRCGLEVRHIEKTYRAYQRIVPVLKEVSFSHGSRTGLIVIVGDNAAGKSTLMHILAGALRPDGGETCLDGQPLEWRARLLRQNPIESVAPMLTVRENLELAHARRQKVERITDLLAKGMLGRLDTLSDASKRDLMAAIDRPAGTLSGGQLQMLALLAATVDRSDVILVDEGTKMLDRVHKTLVEGELLRLSKERLVILATHEPRLDLAPAECHFTLVDGVLVRGVDSTKVNM